MKIFRKRKCVWCPVWFPPNHRLGGRQKSCGSEDCKRKQKRHSQQRWQKQDRDDYRQAQRDWRGKRPDYWKTYRKEHFKYTARNRTQSLIRKKLRKTGLQKRIDILEVTEKNMEFWNLPLFAKQSRSIFPLLWAYTPTHEFQSASESKAT